MSGKNPSEREKFPVIVEKDGKITIIDDDGEQNQTGVALPRDNLSIHRALRSSQLGMRSLQEEPYTPSIFGQFTRRDRSRNSRNNNNHQNEDNKDIEIRPTSFQSSQKRPKNRTVQPRHRPIKRHRSNVFRFEDKDGAKDVEFNIGREAKWKDLNVPLYDNEGEAATRHSYGMNSTMPMPKRALDALKYRGAAVPKHRAKIDWVDLDNDGQSNIPEAQIPEGAEIIDIEDLDDYLDAEVEKEDSPNMSDLPSLGCGPISLPWVEIGYYNFHTKVPKNRQHKIAQRPGLPKIVLPEIQVLKHGECVELSNGSFLHIDQVVKNLQTDEIALRGWKMVRTRALDGLLPKKLNELCYVFEHVLEDPRSVYEQNTILVGLDNVLQTRELIRTNYPFPELRFRPEEANISQYQHNCVPFAEKFMKLVVRWKLTTFYNDLAARARECKIQAEVDKKSKYPLHIRQRRLEALAEGECSRACFMSSNSLRATYRPMPDQKNLKPSGAVKGNSNVKHRQAMSFKATDIADSKDKTLKNVQMRNMQRVASHRFYTYGDAFCGAGGTTSGARSAGFKVKWGMDMADNAGKTWRENFPEARHYHMTAISMIGLEATSQQIVDCLHLSPPCQVWSPVHTREGKNDEQNFATLFACEEIIKKAKPRFVTLEQTFGIMNSKYSSPFNALIQMFTGHGYSISWQILDFQKYGLAQSRRRCIIIAAGPGDIIPDIPEYTHSDKPHQDGLKPYTTVQTILNSIPSDAPNHNIREASAVNIDKLRPIDASKILPCITCDGGVWGHPNGKRAFTIRELAAFQSFPNDHIFMGNEIKKQIGNAFASMIAEKVLFKPIMRQLKEADSVQVEVVDLTGGGC